MSQCWLKSLIKQNGRIIQKTSWKAEVPLAQGWVHYGPTAIFVNKILLNKHLHLSVYTPSKSSHALAELLVAAETTWPAKPLFTNWPFKEKICWRCSSLKVSRDKFQQTEVRIVNGQCRSHYFLKHLVFITITASFIYGIVHGYHRILQGHQYPLFGSHFPDNTT